MCLPFIFKGKMQIQDELSLKFGMVDVHRAEVDLLSATGLSVQLHPPFLLYITAHHSRSLQSWWQHIMVSRSYVVMLWVRGENIP